MKYIKLYFYNFLFYTIEKIARWHLKRVDACAAIMNKINAKHFGRINGKQNLSDVEEVFK